MNNELRNVIIEMANVVESRSQELVNQWEKYFEIMDIPEDEQKTEFEGIIRLRLGVGIVNLSAPYEFDILRAEEFAKSQGWAI